MSSFEKIYQIDPLREETQSIEKHPSIELSDEMIKAGFVFRQPCNVDKNSPEVLRQRKELAELLCKETQVITLHSEPALIPMNIEVPILEKQIKEKGMHPKPKAKKGNKIAKSK